MDFLEVLSFIIGWAYFIAWSVSFYPQVYDNYVRKSVVGLSFDFLTYNVLGHTCYLVYNVALKFSPSLLELYMKEHPDAKGAPVHLNDVVFSVHAVALTCITISQCIMYERGKQRVSWLCILGTSAAMLVVAVMLFLSLGSVVSWLWFLNTLGYVKLFCSFVKYCPQAIMNCVRRSTIGWSIGNILLDLSGGMLSVLQMTVDSINTGEWTVFYGNIPKAALGWLSIAFDLFFCLQHYVLFRKANKTYWKNLKAERAKKKENERRKMMGLPPLEDSNEEEAAEEAGVKTLEQEPVAGGAAVPNVSTPINDGFVTADSYYTADGAIIRDDDFDDERNQLVGSEHGGHSDAGVVYYQQAGHHAHSNGDDTV